MQSKYGVKITNIQAGSIFEYNCGVRDNLDTTPAMLVNSLFKDFLVENGLKINKRGATKDIICLDFKYGSRSAEEESEFYKKLIDKIDEKDYDEEKRQYLLNYYNERLKFIEDNKDKFVKISKQDLRIEYYEHGVSVTYDTRNKEGKIIKKETIHYKMLYRTPGKAKKGTCMFICDRLYKKAKDFLYMGITLPKQNAPIVEIGAYASLVTSGIEDTIEINPKDILILKDVDSFMKTNVVSIETDENKHCYAERKENYELKNTLFDGQGLIDTSIFPEWADGYILLRHHMTKFAAFHSNIQMFFKDFCQKNCIDYQTFQVEDMWGNKHYAKDIKVITTDNAIKWKKFGIDYDYWCNRVNQNGNKFGIVKTAHKSKLGEVQQMSYQMVNALDIECMDEVMATTKSYIETLKNDDEAFLRYLSDNVNFMNDYDALIDLVKWNPDFINSQYFKERRKYIIKEYVYNIKFGKLIQNGDNLVIVGSPYAMLLHSVGEDVELDNTFKVEDDCIQCYSERFEDGEYLAAFRSPFNSKNNMGYLHNNLSLIISKYFNLGKQIIAVNMQHTCFQDRSNGSDQDSDSIYTTNSSAIVECARKCYRDYPTIVNNIPYAKNDYSYSLKNYAKIDNNLAEAQTAIGESSNIAQQCLSLTYNDYGEENNKMIDDNVCILSVVAQCAIDNAKRSFDIDIPKEIKIIKKQINDFGYPVYWKQIKANNDKRHNNGKRKPLSDKQKKRFKLDIQCPMNCVYGLDIDTKTFTKTIKNEYFFVPHELIGGKRKSKKVEKLIEDFSLKAYKYNVNEEYDNGEEFLLRNDFDRLIVEIRNTYISGNYIGLMSWLINRAFLMTPQAQYQKDYNNSKLSKNKSLLLKTLYLVNKDTFLKCFLQKSE